MKKFSCECCDKKFETYPSHRTLKHIYCSRECAVSARNTKYAEYLDGLEELLCASCGETKPYNEFSLDQSTKRGRTYDCKICIQKNRKDYLSKNPHIREKINAQRRQCYQAPEFKTKQRRHYYKKRYGITPEEYEQILKKQGGVCAICGKSNNHKTQKHFHVDHNHVTKKVRGLLCIRCNTVIGNSKEQIGVLEKAIKYLKEHLDET